MSTSVTLYAALSRRLSPGRDRGLPRDAQLGNGGAWGLGNPSLGSCYTKARNTGDAQYIPLNEGRIGPLLLDHCVAQGSHALTAPPPVTCPGPWHFSLISPHSIPNLFSPINPSAHLEHRGPWRTKCGCLTMQVGEWDVGCGNRSSALGDVKKVPGLGSFWKGGGEGLLPHEVWAGGCFTQPGAHPEV